MKFTALITFDDNDAAALKCVTGVSMTVAVVAVNEIDALVIASEFAQATMPNREVVSVVLTSEAGRRTTWSTR